MTKLCEGCLYGRRDVTFAFPGFRNYLYGRHDGTFTVFGDFGPIFSFGWASLGLTFWEKLTQLNKLPKMAKFGSRHACIYLLFVLYLYVKKWIMSSSIQTIYHQFWIRHHQLILPAKGRALIVSVLDVWFKYRFDNERECSMGYSVPRIDRRPRGPKARVAYLCEGHYIP